MPTSIIALPSGFFEVTEHLCVLALCATKNSVLPGGAADHKAFRLVRSRGLGILAFAFMLGVESASIPRKGFSSTRSAAYSQMMILARADIGSHFA